jgi:stage IV sporulation protein A
MENRSIYADIAKRTEGNIYIGVVGPVRTGKSTFIKRFMESLVLPNIEHEYARERAIDELPQSSGGKTIMTTEPKFIPEEAILIKLDDTASLNVRMIDCVGYIVPSALGYIENENPRMVATPWYEEDIPFPMAAEIGTRKVITDHSSIGLVVTSDGSITDIPRLEYEEVEERVIAELLEIGKPFAVLLNCVNPNTPAVRELVAYMENKYNLPIHAANCLDLGERDIREILTKVLYCFPVREIAIDMPGWICALEKDHWLKSGVYRSISDAAKKIEQISSVAENLAALAECEHIRSYHIDDIDLGRGSVKMNITIPQDLMYKVLSETTGLDIGGEANLLPCLMELAKIKRAYDKIRGALDEVSATGYGIVMPGLDELTLEEPEIVNQGGRYGVKLRASAPSIHIV